VQTAVTIGLIANQAVIYGLVRSTVFGLMRSERSSMKKRSLVCLYAVIAMVVTFAGSQACRAADSYNGPETTLVQGQNFAVAIRGSAGFLVGEARELVYDFNFGQRRKASELIWDLKDLYMVGGVVSARILNRVDVNLGISTAINEGSGGMIDYDWFANTPGAPSPDEWTDRSFSDAQVTTAMRIDVNAAVRICTVKQVKLKGIVGFKQDNWKWTDSGQGYIYSADYFRDTVGSFGGRNVVQYEQTFTIPYLGIGANRKTGPFDIGTYFLFSNFVSAEDKDFHVARNLHFKETFSGGSYVALGLNAEYHISQNLFVSAAIDFQSIPEIAGDMELNGQTMSNNAGISHTSTMLSGSIGYSF